MLLKKLAFLSLFLRQLTFPITLAGACVPELRRMSTSKSNVRVNQGALQLGQLRFQPHNAFHSEIGLSMLEYLVCIGRFLEWAKSLRIKQTC